MRTPDVADGMCAVLRADAGGRAQGRAGRSSTRNNATDPEPRGGINQEWARADTYL